MADLEVEEKVADLEVAGAEVVATVADTAAGATADEEAEAKVAGKVDVVEAAVGS